MDANIVLITKRRSEDIVYGALSAHVAHFRSTHQEIETCSSVILGLNRKIIMWISSERNGEMSRLSIQIFTMYKRQKTMLGNSIIYRLKQVTHGLTSFGCNTKMALIF